MADVGVVMDLFIVFFDRSLLFFLFFLHSFFRSLSICLSLSATQMLCCYFKFFFFVVDRTTFAVITWYAQSVVSADFFDVIIIVVFIQFVEALDKGTQESITQLILLLSDGLGRHIVYLKDFYFHWKCLVVFVVVVAISVPQQFSINLHCILDDLAYYFG